MHRSLADIFIKQARDTEAERRRRRLADEEAERRRREDEQRKQQAREAESLAKSARDREAQIAFQQRFALWSAEEDRKQALNRERLRREEEQRQDEARRQQEQAQIELLKNSTALMRIIRGQDSFPSLLSWPDWVNKFCGRIRQIIAGTDVKLQEAQRTGVLTLTLEEQQSFQSYQELLDLSGTTNPDLLEAWLISHYPEVRAQFFREILKDSDPMFTCYAALF